MKKVLSNKYMMIGILAVLLIIGGTFAFWQWTSTTEQNTNVAVTIDTVKVLYVKGPDITGSTLFPTTNKEDGIVKEIEVKTDKASTPAPTINFYLDINTLPNGLKDASFKWEFHKNGTSINNGNFSTWNEEDTITLTSGQSVTTSKDVYTLYIWIDGTMENPSTQQNQLYNFTLRADGYNAGYEEEKYIPPANKPNLHEGIIPIKYEGDTWVKADVTNTSNDWYDYDNKIWANAVMVTEGTRTQHMSNPAGTEVPEADILAYLVWIPRYKYQLFNVEFAVITQKEIQIEFEKGTASTGETKCSTSNLGVETCTNKADGNWYTHPAFTFGDDELTGLWVGKFETSTDPATACFTSSTPANCNNGDQMPRIKPNVNSLRNQNVSNQFATSRKFNSATYVTGGVDAHMMKNIEWGAVAYLTQSKYGRCTDETCSEVSINNSSGYYTGRSGGGPGGTNKTLDEQYGTGGTSRTNSQGYYTYDGKEISSTGVIGGYASDRTLGYSASATGNIYGIYDMSGGAYEYTMAAIISNGGELYSGNSTLNNSGFTGLVYNSGSPIIYDGTPFPESKYYDLYKYGTSQTDFETRTHLGDATGETRKWYGDNAYLTNYQFLWFPRGGWYSSIDSAGMFSSSSDNGISTDRRGLRVVLR